MHQFGYLARAFVFALCGLSVGCGGGSLVRVTSATVVATGHDVKPGAAFQEPSKPTMGEDIVVLPAGTPLAEVSPVNVPKPPVVPPGLEGIVNSKRARRSARVKVSRPPGIGGASARGGAPVPRRIPGNLQPPPPVSLASADSAVSPQDLHGAPPKERIVERLHGLRQERAAALPGSIENQVATFADAGPPADVDPLVDLWLEALDPQRQGLVTALVGKWGQLTSKDASALMKSVSEGTPQRIIEGIPISNQAAVNAAFSSVGAKVTLRSSQAARLSVEQPRYFVVLDSLRGNAATISQVLTLAGGLSPDAVSAAIAGIKERTAGGPGVVVLRDVSQATAERLSKKLKLVGGVASVYRSRD